MNEIPQTLLIADVKQTINSIVNHPKLSPVILELIFKEAYIQVSIRAEKEVSADLEKYKASQDKEIKNQEE